MASKALTVIETTTASQSSPIAAIDFRCNEEAMPHSKAMALANVPPAGGDLQLRHLQTDLLGSANYQVALIPPAKQTTHVRGLGSPPPMLLLSLTWKELVARVRAEADESRLLQRSIVHFGGVSVDLFRVEVTRSDSPVFLTAMEFKVLKFFVTNPGRVISRDELLDRVWGYENYPVTRTVDNQLMRLRQKLEADPRNPVHFRTVHGVAVFWLLGSQVAFVAIAAYLSHGGIAAFQALMKQSGKLEEASAKTIGLVGGIGGAVASLMLFFNQLSELFKSPASFDRAAGLFAKPNYDGRLPLIHQVRRDFNSLVTAYADKEDVYVFIEDLDRCEYAKAAELMQALLMLLSSAPKIALIVGLDRDKVAAAMAAKQEKLIPYLYKIQPGDAYKRGKEYGQRFIEKFIQVSFVLPSPRPNGLKAMINPDVKPPTEAVPESQKSESAINIVTGKDDSKTLNRMIEMADEVFDHNPRNVKQFVNMFRLQAFIANETGLFGSWRTSTGTGRPLTIPQLGKFVALCMRWPDFVENATENQGLVEKLESTLTAARLSNASPKNEPIPESNGSELIESGTSSELREQAAFWVQDKGLMNLLAYGLFVDERSATDFTLADVDFKLLNEIAPPRSKSPANLSQEDVVPEAARAPGTRSTRGEAQLRSDATSSPRSESSNLRPPPSQSSPSRRESSSSSSKAMKKQKVEFWSCSGFEVIAYSTIDFATQAVWVIVIGSPTKRQTAPRKPTAAETDRHCRIGSMSIVASP